MKKIFLSFIILIFIAVTAEAHSIWINCFESHAHKPPHAMVSLGWGHTLPMDDILNSPNGRVAIERFEIFDPAMTRTNLIKPPLAMAEPSVQTGNMDIFAADLAAQKVALKEDSAKGVYQMSAVSVPNFYTQYIDADGKQRLKMKPRNEIKDMAKVLMSVKYQAFAKSYMAIGPWSNPEPLGHGLEIIPRTDLANLRPGDLVEVDVLFYGQPLTVTAKSIEYITASSAGFGQSDGFSLFSYIMEGKAQFRVQNSGQWVIIVNHKDDVTQDGQLKDLVGKANQVYHSASLTFTVK